ncbi:MAG: DUF1232 domain-containing protein [Cyclobacteriaceae bacterium]|nr:DUF1232 domain-containing protein [Cyclobacteriaceae bacterium]MCH8517002.1 DUF1232 domain-containing protein [Cyclobacteriaceae bacterium]
MIEKLKLLFNDLGFLLNALKNGTPTVLSKKGVFVLLLSVLYIVSPIDFIPDFIPVVGWADDFSIFLLAVHYAASQSRKKINVEQR